MGANLSGKIQRKENCVPYRERRLGIKCISMLRVFQENQHLPVPSVGVKSIERCREGGGLNRGEITLFVDRASIVRERAQRRFYAEKERAQMYFVLVALTLAPLIFLF